MIYIITYDINKVVKNYDKLYDAIKYISGDFQHPLESTWFVYTNYMTQEEIYKRLRPYIGDKDHLFIARLTKGYYYGWLSKNVWDWITAHGL